MAEPNTRYGLFLLENDRLPACQVLKPFFLSTSQVPLSETKCAGMLGGLGNPKQGAVIFIRRSKSGTEQQSLNSKPLSVDGDEQLRRYNEEQLKCRRYRSIDLRQSPVERRSGCRQWRFTPPKSKPSSKRSGMRLSRASSDKPHNG